MAVNLIYQQLTGQIPIYQQLDGCKPYLPTIGWLNPYLPTIGWLESLYIYQQFKITISILKRIVKNTCMFEYFLQVVRLVSLRQGFLYNLL